MSKSFIPGFHFKPAEEKLTPQWCDEVLTDLYHNGNLVSLLDGKKINQIKAYAKGEYSLEPFKRMFSSLRKQMQAQENPNVAEHDAAAMDTTGIHWECVPIIPSKINAAVAINQKRPLEITATCLDPLANTKKEKDLEYLKNKPKLEGVLQALYDSMGLGEADLGPTEYSSVEYRGMPMELDVDDEDDFKIFADLIYRLAPETAFETLLQQFYGIKKAAQVKGLEITDHYHWGVSVNWNKWDKITGLPNIEYVFPGAVETNPSSLPDFSDRLITVISKEVTPIELMQYFPDDIPSREKLDQIVNGVPDKRDSKWGWGYAKSPGNGNGVNAAHISHQNWGNYKMQLKYIEVRSVDYITVGQKPKSGYRYFTKDDDEHAVSKIWAQNTYCFYWLRGTKWFFGIDRLPFAYRAPGSEIYQGFSTNIYRSQIKSAVELSIGENKKAQIADIKLQHHIIKAKPPGAVIDIKYLKRAIETLADEPNKPTQQALLTKAIEENIHIISSAGFDDKGQTGQMKAVSELVGGLREEINGYYMVIDRAKAAISAYTSINDQLTGMSANPEGLVGIQKLLINMSMNALHYVDEAILHQYQSVFNIWAFIFRKAIEAGGSSKQAVVNMIGNRKVRILQGLDDVPIHQIGIQISIGMREEARAMLRNELGVLRQKGVLTAADEYFIMNTSNPKDAAWLLAVKEAKFMKKQDQRDQANREMMQNIEEMRGNAMKENTELQTQGKIAQIEAQGGVEAELMRLGSEIGISGKQMEALIKRQLQAERIDAQTVKSLKTIAANKNAEAQQSLLQNQ